jgi:hypothetical protein
MASSVPDYSGLLGVIWGNGYEGFVGSLTAAASGVIVGVNPPYSATDFFAMYPAFAGKSVSFTATTDGATAVLTAVSSIAGLVVGSFISGPGIPSGATILSIGTDTVTISKNTTAVGTLQPMIDYPSPLLPVFVLSSYIFLASASLASARYCDMWPMVMGLFIAHYSDLWLQTQASTPNANAMQVATAGLAMGIKTSKSAGDVSVGLQPLNDLEGWGAFQLTAYGQQFVTIAMVIGSMPMFLH